MRSFFYVLYYQILQLHTINILQVQSISVSELNPPMRFFSLLFEVWKRERFMDCLFWTLLHVPDACEMASKYWCEPKIEKYLWITKSQSGELNPKNFSFWYFEHYAFRGLDGVKQMYAFDYYSTFVLSLPFLVLFR